jgi:hypothetical protein
LLESLGKLAIFKGSQTPATVFIIDVAIGSGENLYVLDHNFGVIPMKQVKKKDGKLSFQPNLELGLMSSFGCKLIKEFNEK